MFRLHLIPAILTRIEMRIYSRTRACRLVWWSRCWSSNGDPLWPLLRPIPNALLLLNVEFALLPLDVLLLLGVTAIFFHNSLSLGSRVERDWLSAFFFYFLEF